MTFIDFKNVYVDFPIYNAGGRSLKKNLVSLATGGRFGRNDKGGVIIRALDNINFRLEKGERVGILGHNGAGKSTLLRVLTGAYAPSSGQMEVEGSIGSLIDISLGIYPEATGRENIYFRGRLMGLSKKFINECIDDVISFSELGDYIDMPTRTYSSGMQLRLAFSISTVIRPNILIMDEWLSVGDESFKSKAEERLNSLVSGTDLLIIASHDKKLVLETCTRVLWLEHGGIKMDADPETVCNAYWKS